MATNPYAPPTAIVPSITEAEQEIRFVIRIFRWIGWIGAVLYVPMPLLSILALIDSLMTEPRNSLFLVGVCLANCSFYALFISLLFGARKLVRRSKRALQWARGLCYLMMIIGFPLFTIVGAICIRKLNRHYDEFVSMAEA